MITCFGTEVTVNRVRFRAGPGLQEYTGSSDVTESMVTKLSPFCGYNMT